MKIQPIFSGIYLKKTVNTNSRDFAIGQNPYSNAKSLSNLYYMPVNFGNSNTRRSYSSVNPEYYTRPADFLPSKIDGLPCPSCGGKMMSKSHFEAISEQLENVSPNNYLDFLNQYEEYMCPIEYSVFQELYGMSKAPDASKDIRTLLIQLREHKLPLLQEVQLSLLKKMRRVSKTLPDNEKAVMYHKISTLENLVKKTKAESPFRRKIMIEGIKNVNIKNKETYKKIQNMADVEEYMNYKSSKAK